MPLLLKGVLCLHPMQDKAIHRPEVMTLRHLHHLFLNPYYTKSHPSSHADFNFIQMKRSLWKYSSRDHNCFTKLARDIK